MLPRHIPGNIIIFSLEQIMVNKRPAPSCRSGYAKNETKHITKFHFPLKNFELNRLWIRFVNRKDWKPTKHSVLCELHFEEKYIVRGGKSNLKWSMNPIPTKHSKELLKMPSSLLPTSKTTRKPPRERLISNDQMDSFRERDTITSLADLNETTAPDGFQFKKSNDHALFYNLVFDKETKFPKILESIKVDSDLHVQLQYNGIPVPLPKWFVQGHNARLKKVSMLENLPAHIQNVVFDNYNELLDELNKRQFLKPKGRLPYSVEIIRYGFICAIHPSRCASNCLKNFHYTQFRC